VRKDAVAFGYVVYVRDERASAFPAHSLKGRNTYAHGLSCVKACSERACKTDVLAGSSDQACLSAASLLSYGLHRQVPVRSSGKQTAICETLFPSSVYK
jgi:hypothetical protein